MAVKLPSECLFESDYSQRSPEKQLVLFTLKSLHTVNFAESPMQTKAKV